MWSADAKRHIRLWERDANRSGSLRLRDASPYCVSLHLTPGYLLWLKAYPRACAALPARRRTTNRNKHNGRHVGDGDSLDANKYAWSLI
ncbi:hypothetical protein EYF80_051047 [Liparis tanakae]|uniref:Uncharacterized protein n=1 Tax=Liparis tanakae TaxID=230148 RepID=A0A4Z2FD12_9TELE|nr:hypothetical protein EYF80_051047 [Liparis tanakae]